MTKTTETMRTRAKAATRAKLITAARRMFQRDGYEAVTIRQLAAAIGMSTGAVFGSFEGKAELFAAAMARPAPDPVAFARMVEALEAPDDPATLAALRAAAGQLVTDLTGSAARP